ncbi:MAG: 50S ribosomal protein L1 [Chloroflexi bacterium]|nr:50S ribosomal protein L1 [Chloroflexota bacterium]
MAKHGKKYVEAVKLVQADKNYLPDEAVELAKKTSYVKFDASVEVHLTMGADPKQADQQIRGVALLPAGLGKKVRVMVFAQGDDARAAQQAGADFLGDDDTIKKIEGGWTEFDVAIATPDMMGKVSKLGRVLGRKGLMPNPKSGTVVPTGDVGKAVNEARKGRAEFRLDRSGAIHATFGKVSFEKDQLMGNLTSVMEAVVAAKPASIKGIYIKGASMSAAMGPSIKLDVLAISNLKAK